jgi:FMN-dependent NADH-azoreductase
MYNFGIPSQLKAWIDRVMVAGKTFRYTAEGPQGLAGGRKLIVAATYGGQHPVESGRNFVEPYLRQVFGFIGITDVEFVDAAGLNMSPEQRAHALESAERRIDEIALPLAA